MGPMAMIVVVDEFHMLSVVGGCRIMLEPQFGSRGSQSGFRIMGCGVWALDV